MQNERWSARHTVKAPQTAADIMSEQLFHFPDYANHQLKHAILMV